MTFVRTRKRPTWNDDCVGSVEENADVNEFRKPESSDRAKFGVKNGLLSFQNGYLWEVILDISR